MDRDGEDFDTGALIEASCFDNGLDVDRSVDTVDTEVEEADRLLLGPPLDSKSSLCLSRFRPRSNSAFANVSSATPFLGPG